MIGGRGLYLAGWALGLAAIVASAASPRVLGLLIPAGGLILAGWAAGRRDGGTDEADLRSGLLVAIACGWIVVGVLGLTGVIG